jgi:DNA-binding transcriptional LysR family regulator
MRAPAVKGRQRVACGGTQFDAQHAVGLAHEARHLQMQHGLADRVLKLIATVPAHLAEVLGRYGTVRCLQAPVAPPSFALSQHWHSRFHHDPAIVWFRKLIKRTFENYPQIPAAREAAPSRRCMRA